MKPFLDTVLFLAWVSLYLSAISWVSRYRMARVHALGPWARSDYRADKDITLWLTVFVLGVLLFFLAYVATRAVSQIL
ncbi:MAG: hypothetical protein ACHQ7N_01560 [Candidatus Methylomirabilales bacterium]